MRMEHQFTTLLLVFFERQQKDREGENERHSPKKPYVALCCAALNKLIYNFNECRL